MQKRLKEISECTNPLTENMLEWKNYENIQTRPKRIIACNLHPT